MRSIYHMRRLQIYKNASAASMTSTVRKTCLEEEAEGGLAVRPGELLGSREPNRVQPSRAAAYFARKPVPEQVMLRDSRLNKAQHPLVLLRLLIAPVVVRLPTGLGAMHGDVPLAAWHGCWACAAFECQRMCDTTMYAACSIRIGRGMAGGPCSSRMWAPCRREIRTAMTWIFSMAP